MTSSVDVTPAISFEGLHLCPVCRKLFVHEKSVYRHVMQVHNNGEYLSYNFRADMYKRWQDRIAPPHNQ